MRLSKLWGVIAFVLVVGCAPIRPSDPAAQPGTIPATAGGGEWHHHCPRELWLDG
jgi:hypothetical protein